MSERVFVYGTLKQGERNHELLRPFVVGVQPARLLGYALWCNGDYPGVRPAPLGEVEGELFTVRDPAQLLPQLDWLEGHPDLYLRRRAPVRTADGDVEAYFYELQQLDPALWRRVPGARWP